MLVSAWRLLIAMYIVAVRSIAEYTPIVACLDWQKSSEKLKRGREAGSDVRVANAAERFYSVRSLISEHLRRVEKRKRSRQKEQFPRG